MQIQISNTTDLGKSVQGQDYTVYGEQEVISYLIGMYLLRQDTVLSFQ